MSIFNINCWCSGFGKTSELVPGKFCNFMRKMYMYMYMYRMDLSLYIALSRWKSKQYESTCLNTENISSKQIFKEFRARKRIKRSRQEIGLSSHYKFDVFVCLFFLLFFLSSFEVLEALSALGKVDEANLVSFLNHTLIFGS